MNVWAIVPVKPLGRAKSRLSDAFSPEQREQLATDLLLRTVSMLLPLVRGVLVISRDNKALSMVRIRKFTEINLHPLLAPAR